MLTVAIHQVGDPWEHSFPQADLRYALTDMGAGMAQRIEDGYAAGIYNKTSFGLVLLDPTAPIQVPSSEAILATIAIGPEGSKYLVNALAKVVEHRDHGVECGILVYTAPHVLTDGDFCWGYSVELNGTYVGASGLTQLQDRYFATDLANGFNLDVDEAYQTWRSGHPENGWRCNVNQPSRRYTDALAAFAASS
jgi:hypothetical protein